MVAVALLVVLGQVTAVVGGADGGADALVGAVGQDEDLPVRQARTMPWARAAVRPCVRPGVARENHRGAPSERAMTCTFIPCSLCFCE